MVKGYRKYKEVGPKKGFTANSALVENYEKAKAEGFQGWCIHHRLETHDENGNLRDKPVSAKELKELGLYYNRPASELIWLTKSDHSLLHRLVEGCESSEVKYYKVLLSLIELGFKNDEDESKYEAGLIEAQDRVNRLVVLNNPLQLRTMRLKYLEEANRNYIDLRLASSQAEEELSPGLGKEILLNIAYKAQAKVAERIKKLEALLEE